MLSFCKTSTCLFVAVAAENQHHYADVNELKQSHFAVVQGQKRTPPVNGGSSGKQNKAGRGCRQQ